jgi:hypothetical protein
MATNVSTDQYSSNASSSVLIGLIAQLQGTSSDRLGTETEQSILVDMQV